MKRAFVLLVLFLLLNNLVVIGQPIYSNIKQGNMWMFGDSIGLDFSYSPHQVFKSESHYQDYSVATLCDTLGRLKYFDKFQSMHVTNVFNRLGQWVQTPIFPMVNFQSISWFLPFTNSFFTGYVSLFNNPSNPLHAGMNEVYYSRLLDTMNQNLGGWHGSLNIAISTFDSIRAWGAAPVRCAKGRDWWLVARRHGDDTMFVMLATPDTMTMVHRLKIGTDNCLYSLSPSAGANGGEMVFSRDGSRLLNVNGEGLVEVYDFDRCSGLLSNAVQVEAPFVQNGVNRRLMYSSCLSPSGRFIYSPQLDMQAQIFEVVQYDLNAPNPTASRFVIYSMPFGNSFFVSLRLAPDNKIYLKPQYSLNASIIPIDTMALSVINFPDSLGAGCGFLLNGFFTGAGLRGVYLSQAPNYDLGPIDGSPCDTLGIDTRPADPDTTVKVTKDIWPEQLKVYPNPVQEQVIIESGRGLEVSAYHLYDLQGKVLQQSVFKHLLSRIEINITDFPPGHYILEVLTSQGVYRRKLVKVGE